MEYTIEEKRTNLDLMFYNTKKEFGLPILFEGSVSINVDKEHPAIVGLSFPTMPVKTSGGDTIYINSITVENGEVRHWDTSVYEWKHIGNLDIDPNDSPEHIAKVLVEYMKSIVLDSSATTGETEKRD